MSSKQGGGVLTGMKPTTVDPTNPLVLLIIQVVIIVLVTRSLNIVLSRLQQPRVISEVIGGIILGPSVFGRIPGFNDTIFPEASLPYLKLVADLGLVLYLFLVGVELDPRMVMKRARMSISISAAGIVIPFALSVAVSLGLYKINDSTRGDSFTSFLLFIGVAMAITAFPVLARIITELKLLHTRVGSTALCAAVGDDITAWVLLALVVSIINASNSLTALYIFLLAIAWGLLLIFLVRPVLLTLIIRTNSHINGPTVAMMAITLILVLTSAFITDIIGVHSIFGAFMVGVIIPHSDGFALGITEKIEDLISILFIPIYFALSGLHTQIGLLNDGASWGYVFLVIFVAMFGKISGCGIVARMYGLDWRESLTVGIFMSCKGLVELIVLNIGLEAGVIDGKVFAILVVMAIVTTCLTTPLALKVFRKSARQERPNLELSCTTIDYSKKNNILVVLNKAEFISSLMTLLQLLQPTASRRDSMSISHDGNNSNRSNGSDDTIMLHVLRLMELGQRLSAIMKSCESANIAHHDPIINVFHMFGRLNFFDVEATLSFRPFHKFADQVVQSAKQSSANLVIIPWNGAGSTAYDTPEDFYKPREYSDTNPQVAQFIQEAYRVIDGITVGVFIDRGLGMAPGRPGCRDVSISVFVPFVAGSDDREALLLLARLAENPRVDATVLRITKSTEPTDNDSRLIPVSTPTMRTVQINPDDTRTDEEGPVNPHIANLQKPPPAHHMSSASISVINYSTADRIASNAADELLIDKYFGPHGSLNSNPRVKYISLRSATPMQTAVEYAKDVVERKDLVIVGHGQHNVTYSHRDEWMEIIRQLRISSNDMRRSLGEMATAMLGGGVEASIFVVQGKKEDR